MKHNLMHIVNEYLQYLDRTKPTNVGIFLLNANEDTRYWILMYPFKDIMYYHDIKLTMPFYDDDHSLDRINEFDSLLLIEYQLTEEDTHIVYHSQDHAFVISYYINEKDLGNLIDYTLPINLQYDINTDRLNILS